MRRLVAFIYIFFIVFPALARAETVEDAITKTLNVHPSVDAAVAALESARAKRSEETSNYYPELSLTGTGGRMYGDNATSRGLNTSRGVAYSWLWEGSLTARQMLFDGFETGNRVDSAAARKLSAELSLADIRETLSFNAAQAYIDLLRAQKALIMIREQASKADDYLKRIKSAVDDGASDEAEYQQAQNVKAQLDGLVAEYKGQAAAAETLYIQLAGTMPQGEMQNPVPPIEVLFENTEEAVTFASENHPSVKAAEQLVKAAKYDIGIEKAALYPDLTGELSYLLSDKKEEIGGEVEDARAVVRLNWALETGGGQFARIRRSKSALREAQARLEEIRLQVERGVRLSYAEYDTAIDVLDNDIHRIKLSKKLLDTLNVQFEGARTSLLQLMEADNQNFMARLEQMNGLHRVVLAQYAILASTGQMQNAVNSAAQSDG